MSDNINKENNMNNNINMKNKLDNKEKNLNNNINNNVLMTFNDNISRKVNDVITPIAKEPIEYIPYKVHFCDYDPMQ